MSVAHSDLKSPLKKRKKNGAQPSDDADNVVDPFLAALVRYLARQAAEDDYASRAGGDNLPGSDLGHGKTP